MRIKPHLSIRSLVAGLAVVAMAVASPRSSTPSPGRRHGDHPAAATCNGYVGLTFDDGPSNDHTPGLLNALKQNGLRATMFNEGQYAAAYPSQVRAEVNAGMWVGNHSYTHPHLTQESQSQIDSEISRTQQAIANAGGGTPKLFRPPYGETNSTVQVGRGQVRPDRDHLGRRLAGLERRQHRRDRAGQRPAHQRPDHPHARVARQHARRDPAHRAGAGQPRPVRRHDLPADRPRRGPRRGGGGDGGRAAVAPRPCPPDSSGATGTTSTSRSPAPTTGP